MIIREAAYIISNPSVDKCPAPDMPEYAFIGRSNVGKSSLINMITDRKQLAKTSANPGKTQLINHFLINKEWYLVDLPGYGYAKVSWNERIKWQKMIRDYMMKRENLMNVFVLVDVRHDAQKSDLEFINWLGANRVPFTIAFTKCDKVSKQQIVQSVERYKRTLRETWEELPLFFLTSSDQKTGREDLLDFIEESNKSFVRK
ncbi:MAG: hypothetical protein RL021_6 [Bacteroidota bacterium]|jgi:GTP-binding protein